MANDLSKVIPQILAQALIRFRGAVLMGRLVNRDFESAAARKGDTIDVRLPIKVGTRTVAPGADQVQAPDITPDTVPVKLDQWEEAPFYMSDKDIAEAAEGTIPNAVEGAVDSLAEKINEQVFAQYYRIYNVAGTAGTTPFGSASNLNVVTDVRKILNENKVPLRDRRLVLDPAAEANALQLSAIQDASKKGDTEVIDEARLTRILGFDWFMDQQVPSHAVGSLTGDPTVSGAHAEGVTSVTVATDADDEVALKKGDIIRFAGDTQNYAVLADATAGNSTTVSVSIEPALKVALSGGEAVSLQVTADHVVNMAFHESAIVLATRPLQNSSATGAMIRSMTDPKSGLTLRLEITRQHKQDEWSLDALWGSRIVRPEAVVRLMG